MSGRRVLMLTNALLPPREGIGHHVTSLAAALRERGHAVHILAASPGLAWRGGEVAGIPWTGYPVPPLRPVHQLAARPGLVRWLAAHGAPFDLLHVHLPLLPPLPFDGPVAVTVHTPMLVDTAATCDRRLERLAARLYARLFSARCERFWLKQARHLFAVSSRIARELACHYRPPRAATVLPNGVDAGFFAFRDESARRDFVLYVGRLGPRKGLGTLIRAFALLARRDLKLVLLGAGPLEARLRRLSRELEVADRVIFAGAGDRERVRDALQRCRLFVLPSAYEGMSLALLEAMAAGAPVVTTEACALPEFGSPPPFTVVPAGDHRALATTMGHLLDSPERRRALAAAARRLVEARFTWPRVAEAFEAAVFGADLREAA